MKTFCRFFLLLVCVSSARAGFNALTYGGGGTTISWNFTFVPDAFATTTSYALFGFGKIKTSPSGSWVQIQADVNYANPGFQNPTYTTTLSFNTGSATVPVGETWDFNFYTRQWNNGVLGDYVQTIVTVVGSTTGPTGTQDLNLSYTNNKPYAVTLKLLKAGADTGNTLVVPANTSVGYTFEGLTDASDYTVVVQDIYQFTDGQWVEAPLGTLVTHGSTEVPAEKLVDSGTAATVGPTGNTLAVPVPANQAAAAPAGAGSGGTVWLGGTGTGPTDALTNMVFREGVDKITSRQDKLVDASKRGEDKLAADTAASASNTESAVQTVAMSKYDSAKAHALTHLGGTSVVVGATGAAPTWMVPLGGATIDVAPWAETDVHLGASILKAIITACLAIGFCRWALDKIEGWMKTTAVVPQARGQTVAGSGGWITSGIAAAVITFILFAAPVAYAALGDTGLGWKGETSLLGGIVTVGGATGQKVVDLLNEFFPVATLLAVIVSSTVMQVGGTAIMFASSVAIRWVIPAIAVLLALSVSNEADASVTVANQRAEDITVVALSVAFSVVVPANDAVVFDAQTGSAYAATGVSGALSNFEALDGAHIVVRADGLVQVAHPSAVWWVYLLKGLVTGTLWELGGFCFRLMRRISGSVETL